MATIIMSKAEFARRRGVLPSAVSNWAARGLLVMAEGPGGREMVDVTRTEARLNANLDPSRGRPTTAQMAAVRAPEAAKEPPAAAVDSVAAVRSELIRAQIISKQLDNAVRSGALVPIAEVERLATEFGRTARERMMAIIRNQAERVAAEKDPRQFIAFMTEDVERAFNELAQMALRPEAEDDTAALEAMEQAVESAGASVSDGADHSASL